MRDLADGRTLTELVLAAQAGDERSWEELMARYGGLVRSVTAAFRLQEADAADVVQSTWMRAVEQLRALRDPERFAGWLKTIAHRECLALPAITRREYPAPGVGDRMVEQSPGPEAQILRAETCAAVRAAVGTLTGRRRGLIEALFLKPRHDHRMVDYKVMAGTIGMPVGSIGPTRARTLGILRERLEQTGFALAGPAGTG